MSTGIRSGNHLQLNTTEPKEVGGGLQEVEDSVGTGTNQHPGHQAGTCSQSRKLSVQRDDDLDRRTRVGKVGSTSTGD